MNPIHCPTYHPVSLLLLSLLCRLGCLAPLCFGLLHRLDDPNSNRLLHVTNGKTSQRWVLYEGLHAHGLAGNQLDDSSITALHMFGVVFELLATSSINLLLEFGKLASNVSGVAIKHRSIASMDLTRVIQNDNL